MWVKKLFPRCVARFSTIYNHDIRIIDEQGNYKLLVNGSRQSGEYIRDLWKRAFAAFGMIPSPEVQSILVLGVAGGTVIELAHALYPDAHITGVDIDRTMVGIGKKYFNLDKIPSLTLTVADAQTFVRQSKDTWDLVIVDVFVGASIPPFVGEEDFLENVKRILRPNGKVIINYLYEFEYKRLSDLYMEKLKKVFSHVADYKIYFNRFFFVVK